MVPCADQNASYVSPPPGLVAEGPAALDTEGAAEFGVGGGRGMGMDDAEIIERSAASCESRCSVGSMGSNGSRNVLFVLGLCCTVEVEDVEASCEALVLDDAVFRDDPEA